ncbi:MAG: cob(I)yrinic acid a,c-diamide adenosyltransferase [Bacilli bacterium]|jgi:cob(I)alamin adenosyltransferase|nr:cob(I)yrinic acid a,c-diamide adenosyltransferase [Bacilli bacterium]
MKVYTKTGDNKQTSVIGQRIDKDSLRINCYGTTDEALSYIGLIASNNEDELVAKQLDYVIKLFFNIGQDLATIDSTKQVIRENDVQIIENYIDELSSNLEPLTNFIGPQGHDLACYANIVRTIIRRSERLIIALSKEEVINNILLPLINRLSDYFFTLFRYYNKSYQYQEQVIIF